MITVQIGCEARSPILMDPMTDEVLESLRTGVSLQVKKDVPAEQVAESKICRENSKGSRIGLPSSMLFACLREAGHHVKNGKKQISAAGGTTLPAFLTIQEVFLPFTNIQGDGESSWKVDKRRANLWNKGKAIAICAVRPRFDKWEFTVTIEYDETKIDESTLKALFDNAGSAQGLGGFRPNCGGPFGRFKVVSWTVLLTQKQTD